MWKKASSNIQTLVQWRSLACRHPISAQSLRNGAISSFNRVFSTESALKTKVEDVMSIATGLERAELAAELEGRKRFDMDAPVGPFGTKEAPAVIQSFYDKRIVGCPGADGEDEHDVVWFWLEKGKAHECPVCSQYFALEVIGNGGNPDGLDDDEHHY